MSDEQLPQVEPDIEAEAESLELDQIPPEQRATPDEPPMANRVLHRILTGNALISVLAVLVAFVIGGILIAITDPGVQAAAGYFFARPGDTFRAIGDAIGGAFSALFQGAIYNFRRPGFVNGIKPLTETLTFATPLIAAGLGVALAFRVGMFNIGGRGQILIAAAVGGWVAWSFELPFFVHMLVAVLAAMVGGALWAGIAGLLKARTGAHEVIVTIMLNYVAFYLIAFLLRTPGALQDPHTNNPISPPTNPNAIMPTLSDLLGVGAFRLNFGFILVILATLLFWFLMNRSSLGFRFRAVGENPHAARVAGINVKTVYVVAMLLSGALLGLAGSIQILGTTTTGFSSGIDAGIGFDAITVALLGRSKPLGVFLSGVLFGALKAGGYTMQAAQGIPIDIILVVQSIIVLLIAAPPLVREIFHLPQPDDQAPRTRKPRRAAQAVAK